MQHTADAKAFGNRTGRLPALLAGGALIAFTAFVAALPPQHQGPQQLRDATGVKLTSEEATIRAASGAGTIPAAALLSQRSHTGTLANRLEGRGGGQIVDVDDDDTDDQDDDDWAQQQEEDAQQQEEEQEEEEQQEEEQQEQDEQDEEQAQQSLQQAEQEIQQSEQEAEEQNEQAEQQALEDEQQAQMDEQQAGQ